MGALLRLIEGFSVGGAYALLLAVGANIDTPEGWRWSLAGTAAFGLLGWKGALKRSRAVADTPTSTIASAAQGYVELQGRGEAVDGTPLLSPLNQLPCLWYHCRVEKKRDNDWKLESSDTSTASFWINDGTGRCLVDPEDAEVMTQRTDTWENGDHRYTQKLLLAGEQLYALGQFGTEGGATLPLNERADLTERLTHWKEDMPALTARYDKNGDGEVDLVEWEAARADALAAVQAEHRRLRALPDTHTLKVPPDGRPFIVSSVGAVRVEQRYRWMAWAHAAGFIVSVAGLGYFWGL